MVAAAIGSFLFYGEIFEFLLTFILVFAIIYGLLSKTKYLGERADVNAAVAFSIAMIFSLSGAIPFVIKILPYFAVIFLAIFMFFFLGKFAGYETENIIRSPYFGVSLIIIFIILVAAIGWQEYSKSVITQFELTNQTNVTGVNKTGNPIADMVAVYNYQCVKMGAYAKPLSGPVIICIFLNPRVLGAIIVLSVTALIVFFIMVEKGKTK